MIEVFSYLNTELFNRSCWAAVVKVPLTSRRRIKSLPSLPIALRRETGTPVCWLYFTTTVIRVGYMPGGQVKPTKWLALAFHRWETNVQPQMRQSDTNTSNPAKERTQQTAVPIQPTVDGNYSYRQLIIAQYTVVYLLFVVRPSGLGP